MAGRIPELGAIIIFALTILTVIIYNFKCWHVVQEGYVGFYYKFGKMMDGMTEPGLHFTFPPPITTNIQVYVRPQVDSVKRVKCGAKDGQQSQHGFGKKKCIFRMRIPIDAAFGIQQIRDINKYKNVFIIYSSIESFMCSTKDNKELKFKWLKKLINIINIARNNHYYHPAII
eukprot:197664_1